MTDPAREAVKRAIDIAVSLAGLVVLLPVLFVIGLAVKCSSPGPVFFRQARPGKAGRLFSIAKFRTMREDRAGGTTRARKARDSPRWAASSAGPAWMSCPSSGTC